MKDVGNDDSATDTEDLKNVNEKEKTKEEVETSVSSPMLRAAVSQHVSSPRQEKRKEDQEKKQQHPLKGPPGPVPKHVMEGIFTQDTVTAWEKKPSLKEEKKVCPPRFSRLLSNLSEEHLAAERISVQALEPQKEQLEALSLSLSLQEQPAAQEEVVPVNFSVSELHHPQQIAAVETVESEPMGLEDHIASTSRDAAHVTIQSISPSAEVKKEDSARAPFPRIQKMYAIHAKLLPDRESLATGTYNSVWSMGQRISHWKLAHQRGYHVDQITQDKYQKHTIMKHERDTKAAVPLPFLEVIEEEALEILKETLKDYQKHLGMNHVLTIQLEERAEKLHLRLKGRGVIE